jgi:cold shock CspA family protein
MSNSQNYETVSKRFTGCVKWFNNKSGYGFITVTDITCADVGLDVFVHHSSLVVAGQQYKYLVQGEYVEFELNEMTSGPHKCQVSNISGINLGKLMCETRNDNQDTRENTTEWSPLTKRHTESGNQGRGRGQGRGLGRGRGRGSGQDRVENTETNVNVSMDI